MLQPSALIFLSVSLVLSDLLLLHIPVVLALLEPPLEHVVLPLKIINDADLVVKGHASGLEPFDFDVFVLSNDLLTV